MQNLRRGSRGAQVRLLQRLINLNRRSTRLAEDGAFGPKTAAEISAFQADRRLSPNGAVGLPTWRALGLTIDISHSVTLFPQPTGMSCWSAAATMLV